MPRRPSLAVLIAVVLVAVALAPPATSQTPQASQTPKSGGVLNIMLREDL